MSDLTREQLIVLERISDTYKVSDMWCDAENNLIIRHVVDGKNDTEFKVDKLGSVFDYYGTRRNFLSFGRRVHFFGDFCHDEAFHLIYVFGGDSIILVLRCPKQFNKHDFFCHCSIIYGSDATLNESLSSINNICVSVIKNHIVGFVNEKGVLMGYSWNDIKCPPQKIKLQQQHEFWYLDTTAHQTYSEHGAFIYSVSGQLFHSLKAAKHSMKMRKLTNCVLIEKKDGWLMEHREIKGGVLLFPVSGGYYKSIRHSVSGAVRRGLRRESYTVVNLGDDKYALHLAT